jgi:predicted ATPase
MRQPLLTLSAENFRSFRAIEVALNPLNVLVGPNEAGKSNFLDLIRFLADSVRMDLVPALETRGGFERVQFRGSPTGPVKLQVTANVTQHSSVNAPDEYALTIQPGGARHVRTGEVRQALARTESFRFKRTSGRGRRITIQGENVQLIDTAGSGTGEETTREFGLRSDALGLATLPKLSAEEGGDEVARIAEMFATFRIFDLDVAAARRPSRPGPRVLRDDGANLAGFLRRLGEDEELFADYVADARAMIPGLRDLEFDTVGGSQEAVAVKLVETGLAGYTDLADASYGTIRILSLLALLYDPNPPLLTCVEEIDHGLHPHVFDRLVERMREASGRTQLLVVTHSPALVNRLRASELIVCERGLDGASRIPAIDPEEVCAKEQALAGTLRLGEIWFSGGLGGVLS